MITLGGFSRERIAMVATPGCATELVAAVVRSRPASVARLLHALSRTCRSREVIELPGFDVVDPGEHLGAGEQDGRAVEIGAVADGDAAVGEDR